MQSGFKTGQLIPILSSKAGSCLTIANWQATGVHTISYYVEDLLIKPGLPLLNQVNNFNEYLPWPGELVFNAHSLVQRSNGNYTLRSAYDGQVIAITVQALAALIAKLQPNKVILPIGSLGFFEQYWRPLTSTMTLYLHEDEAKSIKFEHYYCHYNQQQELNDFLNYHQDQSLYLMGEFNLSQAQELLRKGYSFESNRAVLDALSGLVYSYAGMFNLLEGKRSTAHQLIENDCSCPTCHQRFTQAYLHHLLQHTPLLAQRYLVQHNVTFCLNS